MRACKRSAAVFSRFERWNAVGAITEGCRSDLYGKSYQTTNKSFYKSQQTTIQKKIVHVFIYLLLSSPNMPVRKSLKALVLHVHTYTKAAYETNDSFESLIFAES